MRTCEQILIGILYIYTQSNCAEVTCFLFKNLFFSRTNFKVGKSTFSLNKRVRNKLCGGEIPRWNAHTLSFKTLSHFLLFISRLENIPPNYKKMEEN